MNNLISENAAWLLLVAAMWGGTNPFIKRGSRGVETVKSESGGAVTQFVEEFKYLFFNLNVRIITMYFFFFFLMNFDKF